MYWVGVFTACMTAFYVFRALFLCFFGEYLGERIIIRTNRPPSMWIPLAILAVLSLGGGLHQHPEVPGADVPAAGRGRRSSG